MYSAFLVTKELLENIVTIHRLALNNLITKNKGNLLGFLWLWINPAIQIGIYSVVFGMGVRNSTPVEGIDFVYWLIAGFIVWNYIISVVTASSRSIIGKMGIVTKMKFPVSVIPVTAVVQELYIHFLMIITVVVVLLVSGFSFNIYWLYILYYAFATTALLIALAIFNSAVTTIIRDYQHIVYNFMRMIFFVTPIMFAFDTMKGKIMKVLFILNPFSYVVEGYRDSLIFSRRTLFLSIDRAIYFWSIVFIIYIVGSILHVRMRKNLLDLA